MLERSFTVDEDTDPAEVMEFVDEAFSTADKLNKATGKIGKDDMKVSYVDGFGNRSEGKDAMAAMQSDMKRKEQAKMESDAEVDEMVSSTHNFEDLV